MTVTITIIACGFCITALGIGVVRLCERWGY
jgi:hypothetical protein